jgi:hypothetical protein
MTDFAWMSVASVNLDVAFSLSCEAIEADTPPGKEAVLDAMRKNKGGQPIPAGVLPSTFFAWRDRHDERKPLTKKMSPLALSGFHFVTSEAADVLRQFDLGGCRLHPVEVLMEDRKTPLPGSYFVLDFDSWKDVFLPDQSPEFKSPRGVVGAWMPSFSIKDDVVALSKAAQSGADLWWNPNIWGAFFLSDPLAQALKKAGVDKPFSLRRCRIV